jgi:hypothetical protein
VLHAVLALHRAASEVAILENVPGLGGVTLDAAHRRRSSEEGFPALPKAIEYVQHPVIIVSYRAKWYRYPVDKRHEPTHTGIEPGKSGLDNDALQLPVRRDRREVTIEPGQKEGGPASGLMNTQ